MNAHVKVKVVSDEGTTTIEVFNVDDVRDAINDALARTLAVYNVGKAADDRTVFIAPSAKVAEKIAAKRQEMHYAGGAAKFNAPTPSIVPIEKLGEFTVAAPVSPAIDASPELRDALAQADPAGVQPHLDAGRDAVKTLQENAGPAPWEVQDTPKPEKKSGRRTNEELAADAGVRLEDVKAWLGEGQRVSKIKIEEFASLHPSAINNQTLAESLVDSVTPAHEVSHDVSPEGVDAAVDAAAPPAAFFTESTPGSSDDLPSDADNEAIEAAKAPPADDEAFQEMPTSAFGEWDPFAGEAPAQPAGQPTLPADDDDLPF